MSPESVIRRKDMAEDRKTALFTKLDEVFEPKDALSPYGLRSKWRVTNYSTEDIDGNMLTSLGGNAPDISFDPKLEGWYKIFLYIPGTSKIALKLTGDNSFGMVSSGYNSPFYIERLYWKSADMTGQSLTLSRAPFALPRFCYLAGVEFVPMTEEEVALWKYEDTRTDTKRIYASDDMHNRLFEVEQGGYEDWLALVDFYDHSDVEWLSLEQIRTFVSDRLPTDDIDEFVFPREGDKRVQRLFAELDYDRVLRETVEYGHKKGLKMSVSLRMGAWGMAFPYDQYYFDCKFMIDHPELRTYDRNGDEVYAMSYAYTEVQDYLIGELVNMARSGCDAVTLIAHRGIPYVLFEKPVADRFYELYGEYPYEYPLDEPRLNRLHCDIMIEFFKRLRAALDREFGKDRVGIHLRGMFSLYDCKVIGLDIERLCAEGLLNAVVCHPQRHYERLDGDVWQEGGEWRIDLDKYTADMRKKCLGACAHTGGYEYDPPYKNYRGELCGPETKEAWVDEWMRLERMYGVPVYFDILPRVMPCEDFRKRALALYELGAERLAMWDTYDRAQNTRTWHGARVLGHKEELPTISFDGLSKLIKVRRIGAPEVSRYNPMWGG